MSSKNQKVDGAEADHPVIMLLKQAHGGRALAEEIGPEFSQMKAACIATGGVGKITIEIAMMQTSPDTMAVVIKSKASIPKRKSMGSTFFLDQKGQLLMNDPQQPDLPLIDVDAAQQGKALRVVE